MQFRHRKQYGKHVRLQEQEISILNLCEGERAVVTHAHGGFGVVRRLAEMGLTPGVEVTLLVRCPLSGPVKIEARGVELALGHGIASKVFVKPLKAEPNG